MAIYAKGSTSEWEMPPEGLKQAVCSDVVDQGIREETYEGVTKQKHKVSLSWELADLQTNGKPFLITKWFTLSLYEQSNLYKSLVSWRKKPFTKKELEAFDLEKLIGVNCQLLLQEYAKQDGNLGIKVANILPADKKHEKLKLSDDYVRVIDRPDYDEKTPQPEDQVSPVVEEEEDDIPF